MRVVVLSSGSKGNATYIETSKNKILLDAGRNYKYIEEKLNEIGVDIESINYIVVSHTHTDHISAIKEFIKKGLVTIVTSSRMIKDIPGLKGYEKKITYEDEFVLDDIKITAIHSSHDAEDSRNFIIEDDNIKLAYITDTGYINQKYFDVLKNLDVYLFESNHDIELLQNGPYPPWLKRRVLSDVGHLSNESAAFYLTKLIGKNTKKIILIHLSETNNLEEIALDTFKKTMEDYNIDFNEVSCAHQNEISEEVII